jgi:hypothetical protein
MPGAKSSLLHFLLFLSLCLCASVVSEFAKRPLRLSGFKIEFSAMCIFARVILVTSTLACGVMLGGCEYAPKATRLQPADLMLVSAEAGRSLVSSPVLAGRDASSPRMVIRPEAATNLSSDRLSRVDRWGITTRILYQGNLVEELKNRNVIIVAEREVVRGYLDRYDMTGGREVASGLQATHVLASQVRSLTRAGGAGGEGVADTRADTYVIDYTLQEVASGKIVWNASSTLRRVGVGRVAD